MKTAISVVIFLTLTLFAASQTTTKDYDPELAKRLGADEYGMKNYVFVILKTGTGNISDKAVRDSLFKGHMENINRLAGMGKLIVAGPFGQNDLSYRGVFIMDVRTLEEAKELLNSDPTIREKVFDIELIPWYGSAALPEYLNTHRKIEKTTF